MESTSLRLFGVTPLTVTNGVCSNFNEWNQSIVLFAALKGLSQTLDHAIDPAVIAHPYAGVVPDHPVKPEPPLRQQRNEELAAYQARVQLYSTLVNLYASELAIFESELLHYNKSSDEARTAAFLTKSRTMKLYLRESVDPLIASTFGPYETAAAVYAFLTREHGSLTHVSQGQLFRNYQSMQLKAEVSHTQSPIEFIQGITSVLFQLRGTPYEVSNLMMRNSFVENLSLLPLYREEFKKYRLLDLDDATWSSLLAELRSTFDLQKVSDAPHTAGYYASKGFVPPPPVSSNNWFASTTCTHCHEKGHPHYNCRLWRAANRGKWVENARVVDAKPKGGATGSRGTADGAGTSTASLFASVSTPISHTSYSDMIPGF
jgi:hypothetical protein